MPGRLNVPGARFTPIISWAAADFTFAIPGPQGSDMDLLNYLVLGCVATTLAGGAAVALVTGVIDLVNFILDHGKI